MEPATGAIKDKLLLGHTLFLARTTIAALARLEGSVRTARELFLEMAMGLGVSVWSICRMGFRLSFPPWTVQLARSHTSGNRQIKTSMAVTCKSKPAVAERKLLLNNTW